MRLKFTPAWLDTLEAGTRPVDHWDTSTPGLLVRVEVSGRKTFAVRYRVDGRRRRLALGEYTKAFGLQAAREAARRQLSGVWKDGADPLEEKQKRQLGVTLTSAITSWKKDKKRGPERRWKGGLAGKSAGAFMPHVNRLEEAFGNRRLAEVTARDLDGIVMAPEAASTRNNARTGVKAVFKWAKLQGLIETNPCAEMQKERTLERDRVLTEAELAAIVRGFDLSGYGPALRLLVYTAARRDEILGARWDWLAVEGRHGAVLALPPEAEKAGRYRGEARRIPLCPQAVALLAAQRERNFAAGVARSPFIFPTSSGKRPHADALKPIFYRLKGRRSNGEAASTHKLAKVRIALVPADVELRDIRRTVANALLNDFKVPQWIVDHVVLGHVRGKIARTYMPDLPLDDGRQALTLWADHVDQLVAAAPPAARSEAG